MADYNSLPLALVTGGSGGIGWAIAQKLASGNNTVVIADIVPPAGEHENIIYWQCDVRKGEDVNGLYLALLQQYKLPDILVLNAGKGIHEQLSEGDPEKWLDVLNLNVMGALRCIRAFVPPMKEQKKGHVVFISSVAATQPYTYGGIYSASKAALEMIAETLRLETLPDIKVTVVAAGITDTGFFNNQVSGHTSVNDIGMGSLSAQDIAEDVFYALQKKGTATLNKIITRPSGQNF